MKLRSVRILAAVTALLAISVWVGPAVAGGKYKGFERGDSLITVEARLRAMGFTQVCHFTPTEASARYFQGRKDGLRLPNYFELITATVGS